MMMLSPAWDTVFKRQSQNVYYPQGNFVCFLCRLACFSAVGLHVSFFLSFLLTEVLRLPVCVRTLQHMKQNPQLHTRQHSWDVYEKYSQTD